MKAYLDIMHAVLKDGTFKQNRTGVRTKYIPAALFQHDISLGFPLLTTKKMSLKNICVELEFFLKGLSSKKWLKERGCKIWNQWANPQKVPYANDEATKKLMAEEDDLGRLYGVQWRDWRTYSKRPNPNNPNEIILSPGRIDQLRDALLTLVKNPLDRRNIVMAWNPGELDQMALPPCHFGFQYVSDGHNLDLVWYQRSCDVPLGVPYDIASYAMLLLISAQIVNLKPRYIIGHLTDVHIYENQIDLCYEQLERRPKLLPEVKLPDTVKAIPDWDYTKYTLERYESWPAIKYPIAI